MCWNVTFGNLTVVLTPLTSDALGTPGCVMERRIVAMVPMKTCAVRSMTLISYNL